ncbi:MAG: ATP-binding cassette domain-containing protein [Gemmatimonadaceae bacterium]
MASVYNSAGERQRVPLACAILSSPSILVLDEATANLDYRTEEMVRASARSRLEGLHDTPRVARKPMVADVDRVLRLERADRARRRRSCEQWAGYFRQMMEAGATA